MKIIPRNRQVRGLLVGCAAVSAVMAGPILVDATAQAQPPTSCVDGGICLTRVEVAAAGTTTETVTVPATATQTETERVTDTVTGPGVTQTVTGPGVTQTVTGPGVTQTVTEPVTTVTRTVTQTVTEPVTVPVTQTVTSTVTNIATITAGTTVTVTVTGSRGGFGGLPTETGGFPTSGFPTGSITGLVRYRPTTATDSCGPPGSTETLADGEVETCGPTAGRTAVYATEPGQYNKIFDDDGTYYTSIGIFAPQILFGRVIGCYYVPNTTSVTPPGGTTTSTAGAIADGVAFGPQSQVSAPIQVPGSDCGSG
jgi:hypothetical protein